MVEIAPIIVGSIFGCIVIAVVITVCVRVCCHNNRTPTAPPVPPRVDNPNTTAYGQPGNTNPNIYGNPNTNGIVPLGDGGVSYPAGGFGTSGQTPRPPFQENVPLPPPANPLYYGVPSPGPSGQPYSGVPLPAPNPYVGSPYPTAPIAPTTYAYGEPPGNDVAGWGQFVPAPLSRTGPTARPTYAADR